MVDSDLAITTSSETRTLDSNAIWAANGSTPPNWINEVSTAFITSLFAVVNEDNVFNFDFDTGSTQTIDVASLITSYSCTVTLVTVDQDWAGNANPNSFITFNGGTGNIEVALPVTINDIGSYQYKVDYSTAAPTTGSFGLTINI